MVGEKGGRLMKLNYVITEWIENKRFAFTAKSKEAEGCYRVEPTEGGCRVRFEENLELKGAMHVCMSPLVGWIRL